MGLFDWKIYRMLKARVPVMVGTHSHLSIGTELAALQGGAPASTPFTANRAQLVPFFLTAPATVLKLWMINGAAVSGNVDMGICDEAGVLKVSKGSTAQSGTNAIQEFDITDTVLMPGRYYWAVVADNATAQFISFPTVSPPTAVKTLGVAQMVTAFPLPSTITFAVSSGVASSVPLIGMSLRTLVA